MIKGEDGAKDDRRLTLNHLYMVSLAAINGEEPAVKLTIIFKNCVFR